MSGETFGQFCANKKSVEEYLQNKLPNTPNEIERLRAENEKLRAALKEIKKACKKPTTTKVGLAFIAAAALKETSND